ncbi:hypothetical protein H8958_010781 [Nasalis larvatus]
MGWGGRTGMEWPGPGRIWASGWDRLTGPPLSAGVRSGQLQRGSLVIRTQVLDVIRCQDSPEKQAEGWPLLDSTNATLAPPAFAVQEIEDQLPNWPTKVYARRGRAAPPLKLQERKSSVPTETAGEEELRPPETAGEEDGCVLLWCFSTVGYDLSLDEMRALTVQTVRFTMGLPLLKCAVQDLVSREKKNFVSRSLVIGEVLSMADMATGVKCGIIYWLFGGAIRNLGSPEHVTKWFQPLQQKYTGMFAMTERGHGSNVRGIQTEATFDLSAQEFVIDTPCENAEKMYIGKAMYGNYAAVFAQLIIDGRSQGPHCFIVPVRDENGSLYPGVTAIDKMYKEGLHGVDNGILIFDKVRIPRENLVDKFGSMAPDGQYHSPVRNKSARFNAMLAALTPSRLAVAFQAMGAMKKCQGKFNDYQKHEEKEANMFGRGGSGGLGDLCSLCRDAGEPFQKEEEAGAPERVSSVNEVWPTSLDFAGRYIYCPFSSKTKELEKVQPVIVSSTGYVYLKWIFERISILNLLQFHEDVLYAFLSALWIMLGGDRDDLEQVCALRGLMVHPGN